MKSTNRTGRNAILVLIACCSLLLSFAGVVRSQEEESEEKIDFDKELEKTSQLIVMVRVQFSGSPEFGAGIIFGRETDRLLIATAYHVLHRGAEHPRVGITLRSAPDNMFNAALLRHDEGADLAVLSVDGLAKQGINVCVFPFDRLPNAAQLKRGNTVFSVGNPNGVPWATPVAPDRVSQIIGKEIVFQSTFISRGHSGGALLNEEAALVGMILADEPPFGRAMSIGTILQEVKRWGYPVQLGVVLANGSTVLHSAAKSGDVVAIKALLALCGNASAKDNHDATPLHFAAAYGTPDTMSLFLKAGADLNAQDGDGDPPLEWAVRKERAENVRFLVKAGAKIDIKNEKGRTSLHLAAELAQLETVRSLVVAGANVNAKDRFLSSPIDMALRPTWDRSESAVVTRGRLQIVRLLADAGAKPSEDTLFRFVKNGSVEEMKLLLKNVADLNAKVNNDETLLHAAAKEGRLDIVELLLIAGADINSQGFNDRTALFEAMQNDQTATADFLVAHGASLKSGTMEEMEELLWHMVHLRRIKEVRMLVSAGVNPNTPLVRAHRASSLSLLQLAVERADVEVVKLLVSAGAEVNESVGGRTALDFATAKGETAIRKVLLDAGAKDH